MTSKFRKCSVSSTPPPYGDESSSDDDPCRVIRGAFLPWWCRNPAISKFAGASNCFPSMRFSDGYSVQNQKYVRASAASPPPRQRGRGAQADGVAAGGRGAGRSVSCSDCPSCCHIRPPRPIAARGAREERPDRACASASSAGSTPAPSPAPSEVNVARVGRPCARGRARRREAAAPAACCALCERAGAGARGPRRCVAGAPARVRRDKQLVSAQRLRFDSAAEVARLQAAVREEYATRVAVHYLLRLGELQLRRRPADDARGGGALRGYMKMRV